jgi:ATP-dependent DNA helicase RecG
LRPNLIAGLRLFGRGEGFDEQPMPGLDSEARDYAAASESFARVRKLVRRGLKTLRLVTEHQGSRRLMALTHICAIPYGYEP